jgi:hypothetical protein
LTFRCFPTFHPLAVNMFRRSSMTFEATGKAQGRPIHRLAKLLSDNYLDRLTPTILAG